MTEPRSSRNTWIADWMCSLFVLDIDDIANKNEDRYHKARRGPWLREGDDV